MTLGSLELRLGFGGIGSIRNLGKPPDIEPCPTTVQHFGDQPNYAFATGAGAGELSTSPTASASVYSALNHHNA